MKARKRNARTLTRRPPSSNSKLERRHFRVLAVVEVRRVWTLRRVLGDSSDLGLYNFETNWIAHRVTDILFESDVIRISTVSV